MQDNTRIQIPAEDELRTLMQEQYNEYLPLVANAAPQLHSELLARSGEVTSLSEQAFVDERTSYLGLTLPHSFNLLERDVLRLRDAFGVVDGNAAHVDTALQALLTATEAANRAAAKAQEAADRAQSSANAAALKTVTIGTTAPLIGGGNLSTSRTLSVTAASVSAAGVVQLNNTYNSTSTVQAATANAVKLAYDQGTAGVNAAKEAKDAVAALAAAPSGLPLFDIKTGKFYCPGYIGQFCNFELPTPPEGWAVRNGQVLPNADVEYPDLWAALQHPAFSSLCVTLAQWNAKSAAANNTGGVPFFVVNTAAKTIKLPDTRGDYGRDAGSSFLQAVGAWHDSGNKSHSHVYKLYASRVSAANANWTDTLANEKDAPTSSSGGAEARTRAFGLLGCVYVRRT